MGMSINSVNQPANTYQSINVSSQEQLREKQAVKGEAPESSYRTVSAHEDTLTISEAGKAASMNNQSGTESESENSTADLSGYTEAELRQMYLEGTITKAEYDEELSRREG